MICSFVAVKTEGPNGTTQGYVYGGSAEEDPAKQLGTVDGVSYLWAPDGEDLGTQAKAIKFKKDVTLTDAQKLALKAQYGAGLKLNARLHIEQEVGDPLDLLADTGKILETVTVCASMAMAVAGGAISADDPRVAVYAQRAAGVLAAIESGQLLIRGNFEDPDAVISAAMPRYSKVQELVRDDYITPLQEVGLA